MRRSVRGERGQSMGMTVIALASLIGMGAFVLDVGAWFRADRQLQQVVDAAALAGVQALPSNPSQASSLASTYATKNGGASPKVTITSTTDTNDTITVSASESVPGFLSRVLGVGSVTAGASAQARAIRPGQARYVAPIVVNQKNKWLQCTPPPCTNDVTLDYQDPYKNGGGANGAGNFGFIDLGSSTGNGTSDLREQIAKGWDQYMPIGRYSARTGDSFSAVGSALDQVIGKEILLPVYSTLVKNGTIAEYTIVGWVGFVVTSYDFQGSANKINGRFTQVVWEGLEAGSGSPGNDYGVRFVQLTE